MIFLKLFQQKILLIILAVFVNSSAQLEIDYKSKEPPLIFACISEIATDGFKFDFDYPSSPFWGPLCLYAPKLSTMTSCFSKTSAALYQDQSAQVFNGTVLLLSQMCQSFGNFEEVSYSYIIETHINGSLYLTNPDVIDVHNFLYKPISIENVESVMALNKEYSIYFKNLSDSSDHGHRTIIYWLAVLSIVGLFNFIKNFKIFNKIFLTNQLVNNFRGYISVANTVPKYHLNPYNFMNITFTLLPTCLETIIIVGYMLMCSYFMFSDYTILSHNHLYGSKTIQLYRFIADRTGILAFIQLPLLIVFGGRNNILINLSGLPYNTFIIFHKWISRMMFILAFVHAFTYSLFALARGSFKQNFSEAYWNYGIMSLSICLAILVQSIYYLRNLSYEIFFKLHCILVIAFLGGCLLHCWKIGWLQWIYYTSILWFTDRFLRIIHVFRNGFLIKDTELKIVSTKDPTFKILIPKPKYFKSFPGCYVYIQIFDFKFNFWESHPFTIFDNSNFIDNGQEYIVICVKPKKGITDKIYKFLLTQEGFHYKVRLILEGPYGHHISNIKNYDNLMICAGGNGVPGPCYHALELILSYSENAKETNLSTNTRKFRNYMFVWVIRDSESLRWYYDELKLLLNMNAQNNSIFKVYIYVTREKLPRIKYTRRMNDIHSPLLESDNNTNNNDNDNDNVDNNDADMTGEIEPINLALTPSSPYESLIEDSNGEGCHPSLLKTPITEIYSELQKFGDNGSLVFFDSRPNFRKLIETELLQTDLNKHSEFGIISCGAPVMCDQLRDILSENFLKHKEYKNVRFDLFEELQVW